MYKVIALLLLALAYFQILGCVPVRGVERNYYSFRPLPSLASSFDCIKEAIESVEGVRNVRYKVEISNSRPLTLTGLQKSDTIHTFLYTYKDLECTLRFFIDYKDEVYLAHSHIYINAPAPQDHIDLIRPIMAKIEQSIENRCAIKGLTLSIKESCPGVECPPLLND